MEQTKVDLTEPKSKRPQDDIPDEVITQYIVKDYQRMWKAFHDLEPSQKKKEEQVKKLRAKVQELIHKLREQAFENLPEGELKNAIKSLIKRVADAELKNRLLQQENEKLFAYVQDLKNGRAAVVEAVTSDLEEQLAEARKTIELLKAKNNK